MIICISLLTLVMFFITIIIYSASVCWYCGSCVCLCECVRICKRELQCLEAKTRSKSPVDADDHAAVATD